MSQIRRGPGFAHSAEAEQHERAHLGDTLEVAIDVYDLDRAKLQDVANRIGPSVADLSERRDPPAGETAGLYAFRSEGNFT